MRKNLLLIVIAMLIPALSWAENKAVTKTRTASYYNNKTERELLIPASQAGINLPLEADGTDSYSIGMWFKVTDVATSDTYAGTVFSFGSKDYCGLWAGFWVAFHGQDDILRLHIGQDCSDKSVQANEPSFSNDATYRSNAAGNLGSLTRNEYHFMLISVDNVNKVFKIYVDGNEAYSLSGQTMGYKWSDGVLGFMGHGMSGAIDEVQLYNKALSAAEAENARSNKAKNIDGLTALYTFNNTSVTNEWPNEAPDGDASYIAVLNEYTFGSNWAYGLYTGSADRIGQTGGYSASFVDGRELPAEEINVTIGGTENGGTLTLTNGTDVFAISAEAQKLMTNTDYEVSATPAEGYALVKIEVTENGVTNEIANNSVISFGADAQVFATFTNTTSALTVVDEGGITFNLFKGTENITGQKDNLLPGQTYMLVPSLDHAREIHKKVTGAKLGDQELTADALGRYSFTMPEGGATFTILSRDLERYTLTINQPEGGTVKVIEGTATELSDGDVIYEGTILTFQQTPETGYAFINYVVNGNNTTVSIYTVNENVTVSAVYEKATLDNLTYCIPSGTSNTNGRYLNNVTLVGTESASQSITTSSNSAKYWDYKSTILKVKAGETITVTPAGSLNWCQTAVWVDWGLDGEFNLVLDANGAGSGDCVAYNRMSFDGGTTYFTTTNSPTPAQATGGNLGNGNTQAMKFTVPAGAKGKYRIRFRCDYNQTDACANLNGGEGDGHTVIDATLEVEAVTLAQERTVSVKSADETMGTVKITSPSTTESSVTTNEPRVTVKATPAAGYGFMNWTNAAGEVVSTDATYNYEGEDDVELTAHFGYYVNIATANGGYISVTNNGQAVANGAVVAPGTTITVVATGNNGWRLVNLKVNGEAIESGAEIEVNETINIEATFTDAAGTLIINKTGEGKVEVTDEMFFSDDDRADVTFLQAGDPIEEGLPYVIYFEPAEGYKLSAATISGDTMEGEGVDITLSDHPDYFFTAEDAGVSCANSENWFVYGCAGTEAKDLVITVYFELEATAIDSVELDAANGPVEYFNLQGVRVSGNNLTPGIYVRRQGGKTVKVLVK